MHIVNRGELCCVLKVINCQSANNHMNNKFLSASAWFSLTSIIAVESTA